MYCSDGAFFSNLFDDDITNESGAWASYGYFFQGKSYEQWETHYEHCSGCSDVSDAALGTWRGAVSQAYRFPDGRELIERWNEEITFVPLGPRRSLVGDANSKKVAVFPADECLRKSGVPCSGVVPSNRSALKWYQTPVINLDSWDGEKYLASVYSNDAVRRSDFFVYLNDKTMSYSYSVRIDEDGDRVSYDVVMERVFPTEDQLANSTQGEVSDSLQWSGNGSGLLVTSSGLLVTCAHVVDQASNIEVEFRDHGKWISKSASLLQVDRAHDVALLQLEGMNRPLETPFRFSMDAVTAEVGERVFACGFPMALGAMGKELKVTDGIINANSGFEGDVTSFQLSAAVQPGSSGGPIFSEDGQFLGLAKGGLSKDVSDNVGYAVKAKYVLDCLAMLPQEIDYPQSKELEGKPLTIQVDAVRQAVVLVKVQ
jgi:S1-C subfamily serine protease